MELRAYYKKIREIESSLSEPFVVLVSIETPDGGKPGVMTEVARFTAAKLIAEGRARVASEDEATDFHLHNLEVREEHERVTNLKTMQFTMVPAKGSTKRGDD